MAIVATYPDSTRTSLGQRLHARARERWCRSPACTSATAAFSYINAALTDAVAWI